MFKDNLIQLRKLKHLTQEDIAERVGVTRQAIAKWESGDVLPDFFMGSDQMGKSPLALMSTPVIHSVLGEAMAIACFSFRKFYEKSVEISPRFLL